MKRKIIGLIHWWIQLEPVRHRHWCPVECDCYHRSIAWDCEGLWCVSQERKACPNCAAKHWRVCKGSCGGYALRCTCGHGSS